MTDNQNSSAVQTQGQPGTLRVIIVDDEELARQGLALRLAEFDEVEILAQCAGAKEAIAAVAEFEPDVLFLDIQMPGMNGFEMIEEIQADILPLIVFVTAYDAYAIDAFRVHAVDYLLKPVEKERLVDAVATARSHRQQRRAAEDKQRLMDLVISVTGKSEVAVDEMLESNQQSDEALDRLAIKDGAEVTFVPVKDIDWIDAAGDYMCVHVGSDTHIMRTTMKQLESRLDPRVFQRVHRSTIVNLERVEKLSSHINGEFHLILRGGATLKMSRSYKDKVKHFF